MINTTLLGPQARKSTRKSLTPERSDRLPKKPIAAVPPPASVRGPVSPPSAVSVDGRRLKLWQNANEDERFLAEALCELQRYFHAVGIESYFRFADAWQCRYPKEDKKNHTRGLNSVKNGAAMSPYSASQVYTILKTIKVYPRDHYHKLAEQASASGLTIRWTHLRTIAARLGKKEYERVRREVEKKLVSQQMTEAQLKKLIDELAPDSAIAREEKEENKAASARLSSFLSSFKRNSGHYKPWLDVITKFEDEFQVDDPKEVKKAVELVRSTLDEFDRMRAFLDESRPILETIHRQVAFLTDHDPEQERNKTERIARSITEKVQTEKRHAVEQRRQREGRRLKLAGEFADDDDFDFVPKAVLRPGDEFVTSRNGGDGEYSDLDGDEFDDEEEEDSEDGDESDEWDDDDIFDEMGNIPRTE